MITYEQVPGSNNPPDIKGTTNDHADIGALIAAIQDADWADSQVFKNLSALGGLPAPLSFVIPSDEVGDCSEIFYDADGGALDTFTDKLNQAALDALEAKVNGEQKE